MYTNSKNILFFLVCGGLLSAADRQYNAVDCRVILHELRANMRNISMSIDPTPKQPLMEAALRRTYSKIQRFFKETPCNDNNKKTLVRCFNTACRYGNTEIVQEFIKFGFSVNERLNALKMTPLMLAAFFGNYPVVDFLIKNGADKMATDLVGNSPRIWVDGFARMLEWEHKYLPDSPTQGSSLVLPIIITLIRFKDQGPFSQSKSLLEGCTATSPVDQAKGYAVITTDPNSPGYRMQL